MLSKEDKIKILNKIISTKEFNSSKTYSNLLKYLVESSIENKKIKEYTIAIDVFGKSSDFNPSEDSSIRVYMSNLRKKLDHYYATEGKNDAYKIEIPKGHYNLNFVKSETFPPIKAGNDEIFIFTKGFLLFVIGVLTFLLLLLLYNFYVRKNPVLSSSIIKNKIWHNLIDDNKPILAVLGNDLFFFEIQDDEQTIIRKHYINTYDEFKYYKSIHPEKKILQVTPYSFFPLISVSELPKLLQQLKIPTKVDLKSSYELSAKDVKTKDIIFIGSFRNLHFLDFLLEDGLYKYSNNPLDLYLKVLDKDTVKTFRQIGAPEKESLDYCLFRKLPGPNNNTIYMFISFFKHGMSTATDYLLSEQHINEVLRKLKSKFGTVPEYFDILFKSSGYSETTFTTSIEYLHKIEPDSLNIW